MAAGLATLALPAAGLGFGREHGDQELGRHFYAEIPAYSADSLRADCVRIRPLESDPGSFLGPVNIAVEGKNNARRITLTSVHPLRSAYVTFLLEAHCDAYLAKEYLFLVSPGAGVKPPRARAPDVATPVTQAAEPAVPAVAPAVVSAAPAVAAAPVASPRAAAGGDGDWRDIAVATNLNTIARQLYPDDREARDRFRSAITRANPERFPASGPVGAVPIEAGTRLRVPEGVDWPGQVRKASPVPPPVSLPAARAEPAKLKDDRLTLNRSANPKLDALGAAMANLEGGMAERDRVQGELVSAAGQTVQSIMEIRKVQTEHLAMLERVQKNLAETIRTMEEDRANRIGLTDILELLAVVIVAAGLLIWLHHRLAMQRLAIGTQAFLGGPFAGGTAMRSVEPSPDAPVETATEASAEEAASVPLPVVDAPEMPPLSPRPVSQTFEPPGIEFTPPPTATPELAYEPPVAAQSGVAAAAPAAAAAEIDLADDRPGSAIIELADLMIAMGMPKNGVISLIQHLDETQSTDPVEWMKLVTTARALKLEDDVQVRPKIAEFFTRFNIRLDDGDPRTSIESFPHVMRAICAAWKDGTAPALLQSLLYDDRQGERAGFPERVAADLIFLLLITQDRFPARA